MLQYDFPASAALAALKALLPCLSWLFVLWECKYAGVYFSLAVQSWIREGDVPPPGGWLQLREQRSDWPAGDCGGHSDRDCDQSRAAEEEAVRHHQSWHCGGELTVTHDVPSFTLVVFNATLRITTKRLDKFSRSLWRIILSLGAHKDRQVQRKFSSFSFLYMHWIIYIYTTMESFGVSKKTNMNLIIFSKD